MNPSPAFRHLKRTTQGSSRFQLQGGYCDL